MEIARPSGERKPPARFSSDVNRDEERNKGEKERGHRVRTVDDSVPPEDAGRPSR